MSILRTELWPSYPPDYAVWQVIEQKACAVAHHNLNYSSKLCEDSMEIGYDGRTLTLALNTCCSFRPREVISNNITRNKC